MKSLRALLSVAALLLLSANAASAQAGKVTCQDGTKSAGGRGACSGHGGIQTAAMKADAKADAKAAKAEKKADKMEMKADKKADKMEMKADKKADKAADKMAMKADDHDAKGAIAECKDHTFSHAATHKGACSRHGGVARFLDGK